MQELRRQLLLDAKLKERMLADRAKAERKAEAELREQAAAAILAASTAASCFGSAAAAHTPGSCFGAQPSTFCGDPGRRETFPFQQQQQQQQQLYQVSSLEQFLVSSWHNI